MPKLTVDGQSHEVANGKRLVLAIEEAGVHIGHRCGGNARCTTCRVEFQSGEPSTMTRAEYDKLKERELLGQYRLSCQIVCDHDMAVHAVMTLENQASAGWTDTGGAPDPQVQPEAVFLPRSELEKGS
jgi:ferredoxin